MTTNAPVAVQTPARPSIFAEIAGGLLGAIIVGTIEDNTTTK